MSEFMSINYTRVVCNKCGAETTIEPGRVFKELNCKCKNEVAEQLNEIKEYTKEDGTVVELIGVFKNGDVEIKYPDGSMSYRMSKGDFDAQFNDITANTQMDDVSEEVDPSNTITLSLDVITDKTADEIKEEFTVEELKVLARSLKIRGASQMNEDKLIEKLLEKAE